MAERFFVETPICGDQAALTGPEAHHLSHVMRARRGAQVVLFDGSGWEFTAAVQRIGRRNVDLRILRREEVSWGSPCPKATGGGGSWKRRWKLASNASYR